jgi:nucleoside-diphosphate-sugar epimerase
MNILLLGGSGFLSGAITRAALQDKCKVSIVTRGEKPIPEGATALRADRKNHAQLETAIQTAFAAQTADAGQNAPWDLVVDCIGYEVQDAKQDIALFRNRARHFVFVSTDFVYDPAKRDFPQSEDNHFYLQDDSYGAKKRRCEMEFENADCGQMQWSVVRPCHIYGPGSRLGCLPKHGRDPQLLSRLKNGETLQLVGDGHFLQQPIYFEDLARLILSCAGNEKTHRQIYQTAGPDIIESREYYRIIAEILGVDLKTEELPVAEYLRAHPEHRSFLCHRIYNLDKLKAHGLAVPATLIEDGLRAHVAGEMENQTT